MNHPPASATRSGYRSCAPSFPRPPRSRSASAHSSRSASSSCARSCIRATRSSVALVALFGVGAAAGIVGLQHVGHVDQLRATRLGVLALGVIVAFFSLSPSIGFALVGAAVFGAAVAWTLASGMGAIQSKLDGRDRVLAFAAFHITIRSGLALAAVGAGAAGQLIGAVQWPVVGRLEPARVVLLCSGIVVALSSIWVREPGTHAVTPTTTFDPPLLGEPVTPTEGGRCQSPS